MRDSQPLILVFGTNCTGKSALGAEVARRLPRCAFIEVDELRYKVRGGGPSDYAGRKKDEHIPQWRMAVELAVRMAEIYRNHGFACVIEGLGDECEPGNDWMEANLGGCQIVTVALVSDLRTLESRWTAREKEDDPPPKHLASSYEAYASRRHLFDCFLDTGKLSLEQAAEAVIAEL